MEFLSNEWFAKVDELRNNAGDLDVPDAMKDVVVNVNVTGGASPTQMHLKGGDFIPGHDPAAAATLSLSKDLARKVFIEGDTNAAMQAAMAGEIKIEGDMMKVMTLQATPPSEKQQKLLAQIKEITD